MGKSYLKRISAPKTWQILRKTTTYITKPSPGPHSTSHSMPLSVLLKEMLQYTTTNKEVRKLLNTNEIKVDNKSRKDFRFPVGIFDTLTFTTTDEHFRIILNKQGKIGLVKIKKDESNLKPCKIIGKKIVKGKVQLNLYDGNNILVEKDSYRVGDTLLISLNDKKISKHLKLDKKASIFLTGGKHIGETGHVEDIVSNKIIYKDSKGDMIETLKEYAFVIGTDKSAITLE